MDIHLPRTALIAAAIFPLLIALLGAFQAAHGYGAQNGAQSVPESSTELAADQSVFDAWEDALAAW